MLDRLGGAERLSNGRVGRRNDTLKTFLTDGGGFALESFLEVHEYNYIGLVEVRLIKRGLKKSFV